MSVFINRTLNLKRIKYIGLDMDHTLVRYRTENFEALSHRIVLEKLVKNLGYPKSLLDLKFDYNLAIRGLVIDAKLGNALKVSRHGAIRESYHGTRKIEFKAQQQIYKSTYIDLGDPFYSAVDTSFSISRAVLYCQIVDHRDREPESGIPDYATLDEDIIRCLDEAHRDNSLKSEVAKNLDHFILKEPEVVEGLERYKRHGKKLFILTNSDYRYTQLLLDYVINPFLKDHNSWQDLFEIVITSSQKPRFFYDKLPMLKVNPLDGSMTNFDQTIKPGIYQGGCASQFKEDLKLEGDDILYIGDHIYGDILRLKKDCSWRTALVIEELAQELEGNRQARPQDRKIDELMVRKLPLEKRLTEIFTKRAEKNHNGIDAEMDKLHAEVTEIDAEIATLIEKKRAFYNKYWGQVMRAGNEESYFGNQVIRYADVYMTKIADLLELSPRSYFRSLRRPLPHELMESM